MIDWTKVEVLTFDCYGTLIDWEAGILATLTSILTSHDVRIADSKILELYAQLEDDAEKGAYCNYKSVLRAVMTGLEAKLGITLSDNERECLVDSIKQWQPFPDTVDALRALRTRFKLAIISNTDDDIFSFTQQQFGVEFDWIVTAEQVQSYKPSLNNFHSAIKRIGAPTEHIVHVAQSLYHDIAPASQLGLKTVWVDRRNGKQGFGATLPGSASADITVPDLRSLLDIVDG